MAVGPSPVSLHMQPDIVANGPPITNQTPEHPMQKVFPFTSLLGRLQLVKQPDLPFRQRPSSEEPGFVTCPRRRGAS
jgi:hypothetical protein